MALQDSILQILAMLLAFQSRLLCLCKEYKLLTDNISSMHIFNSNLQRFLVCSHFREQ